MTTRSPRRYVVLGGGNGSGNRGDEIMWEATVDSLRRVDPAAPVVTDGAAGWTGPLEDVDVLPGLHHAVRRLHRVPRHRVETAVQLLANRGSLERGLRRCAQLREGAPARGGLEHRWEAAVRDSRAVVVAGSGGMTDPHALHAIVGWGMVTELAARHGVPVAFLGQGVGPLDEPSLREALGRTLDRLSLFTVRDQESVAVVRSINPRVRVLAAPDWALLGEPTGDHRRQAARLIAAHVGTDRFVAISLRSYRTVDAEAHRHVTDVVRRVVRLAASRACRVLMVPNVVTATGRDDRRYMKAVVEQLDAAESDRCSVLDEPHPAQVTRAVLGASAGVFSTRYHPLVFALAEGAPGTGIAFDRYYVQKLGGALDWYGERDRVAEVGASTTDEWLARGLDDEHRSVERRRGRTVELARQCEAPFTEWLEALG